MLREMVFEWAERFSQKHSLKVRFHDDAVNAIVDRAVHQKKPVREMCNQLFGITSSVSASSGKTTGRRSSRSQPPRLRTRRVSSDLVVACMIGAGNRNRQRDRPLSKALSPLSKMIRRSHIGDPALISVGKVESKRSESCVEGHFSPHRHNLSSLPKVPKEGTEQN